MQHVYHIEIFKLSSIIGVLDALFKILNKGQKIPQFRRATWGIFEALS
jgi:hypothetical protein